MQRAPKTYAIALYASTEAVDKSWDFRRAITYCLQRDVMEMMACKYICVTAD